MKLKSSVERIWAFVFYCFLKFELKTRGVYKYLNPFFWVGVIKSINRKQNFNHNAKSEFKNEFLNDRAISNLWAGIYIAAYLAILICIVFNFIGGRFIWYYILSNKFNEIVFVVILIILCSYINHCILYQKKKYLIYFQEFENLNRKRKWQYGTICMFFFLIAMIFFLYSFKYEGLIHFILN